MAFWKRMKQSQIPSKLWNNFTSTRSYSNLQIPPTPVFAIASKPAGIWFLNHPLLPDPKSQLQMPTNVRYYAKKKLKQKPLPKKVEKEDSGPRLNEQITADVIRLVTDEGHSIMSKFDALKMARSLDLDLVEVQRNATPPVCKIKDYLKEKYKQETKEKERAKEKSDVTLRQGSCKEIRFSGKITLKDLQVKADAAKRLMESGYRVKCVAVGNGSSENGESSTKLLSRFAALVEDIIIVESQTKVEDKDQAHIIIRHVKYGPSKKASGKKANKDNKAAIESADAEADETKNSGWTAVHANDRFDQLFDISENRGMVSKSPNSAHGTSQPVPGSPNILGQPQAKMNASPRQSRETQQGTGIESSKFNGHRFPQQGFPPKVPGSSPTPNFGIFNAQRNAPEKNSGPVEVNRYKQRAGSEYERSSRSSRPPIGRGNRDISSSRNGDKQQVRSSYR
ncbi:OLC1v1003541C1 [Oldenlandia corymbosa var. corymbosa]|uniref:OLC1v1003541C1 n=1 Tax=Oldenlandia corymbosa var. corymbosa TaxID=529605 RepID=A0AAV1DCM7_OLDCO|nr:OLC1v1003541C1 [Oldenlandia corymbosa var. corymbosa]